MSTPLKIEDFDLSPEDMKQIVEGAQQFLPPVEMVDDSIPVDATPKP